MSFQTTLVLKLIIFMKREKSNFNLYVYSIEIFCMCYFKQVIYSPFYTLYKTLFHENIIIMLSILQIVLYTIKKHTLALCC